MSTAETPDTPKTEKPSGSHNHQGSHKQDGSHKHQGSHRQQEPGQTLQSGTEEQAIHTMEGVPAWMGMSAVVAIILVSHFVVFAGKNKLPSRDYWRLDLFKLLGVKWLVKKQWFPLAIQSLSVAIFMLILATGFFGNPYYNIAPTITWTLWWALLIFIILGFGKSFCSICPWEGLTSLMTSFSLSSRKKKIGFEWKWPKKGRNVYPALVLFIFLTWYELGYDITRSGSLTALAALGMFVFAAATALFFEKRSFCRYACLVGRISGIYALFSPVELRSKSAQVCLDCKSKECIVGSEEATGCPTYLYPGKLKENTYCTLCTECIRACPHDNLSVFARPLAKDLVLKTRFRWDEAILAIVLLAMSSFHGFTMTPIWWRLNNLLRAEWGFGPTVIFTILMTLMIVIPVIIFWFGAWGARVLTRSSGISTGDLFKAFAYAIIPIALFYHLAHNSMHFFMEGQHVLPLLSDPFGWGWDLFGTAKVEYNSLLSLNTIWWIQTILIVIGHIYGVVISDSVARKLFQEKKWIWRSQLPQLATMVLYSCFSIWLIVQPMEMRSGM